MSEPSINNSQNLVFVAILSVFAMLLCAEYLIYVEELPSSFAGVKPLIVRILQWQISIRVAYVSLAAMIFIVFPKNPFISSYLDQTYVAKILAWIMSILSVLTILNLTPHNGIIYRSLFPASFLFFHVATYIALSTVRQDVKLLDKAFGFVPTRIYDWNCYSFNWHSKWDGYINIVNPFRGVFIGGNPGAGKGYSAVEPILEQVVYKGFTGLIYDFKFPVLAKYVHDSFHNYRIRPGKPYKKKLLGNKNEKQYGRDIEFRKKTGTDKEKRKLWFIDFYDLSRSHRCNPIAPRYMQSPSDANEMAVTLLYNISPELIEKKDFFSNSAVVLLSAIFWFQRTEIPECCTIPHAIAMAQQPYEKLLAALKTNDETSKMMEVFSMADRKKAEAQLSGQVASLLIPASKLNAPEISYILSEDDFSLALNDPANPGLLVVGNNINRLETYGPVVALIATVANKQMNQPGRLHSTFFKDEAPTIYIPKYDSLGPATARSNKVAHVYIAQTTKQIESKYGEKDAKTILGTLGNHIYLQTSLIEDASMVSRIIGRDDQESKSISTNKEGKKSGTNISKSRLNLIEDEQMMTLEMGRMVGKLATVPHKRDRKGRSVPKYSPVFNVKPDLDKKEDRHAFNPIVKIDEHTGIRSMDKDEIFRDIAEKKHRYISQQAKEIVDTYAQKAVRMKKADEKYCFPEHFGKDAKGNDIRLMTLLGDPIDESGFIRDRKSGQIIGSREKGYYPTIDKNRV